MVVFGSTARGDGDPDSDIDLLITSAPTVDSDDPACHQDLTELAALGLLGSRWTGNVRKLLDRSAGCSPRSAVRAGA